MLFCQQVFGISHSTVEGMEMEMRRYFRPTPSLSVSLFRQLQQQQQAELEGGGARDGLYEAGPITLSQVRTHMNIHVQFDWSLDYALFLLLW